MLARFLARHELEADYKTALEHIALRFCRFQTLLDKAYLYVENV